MASTVVLDKRHLNSLEAVFAHAFSAAEAPRVAQLTRELILHSGSPENVCLGHEVEHRLVACLAMSPVFFTEPTELRAYILAPLAVHKAFEGRGIASKLIEEAQHILVARGVDVLLVYGDPKFYGRFGFGAEAARSFIPPYALKYPFGWQAKRLGHRPLAAAHLPFHCVEALSDAALW